VLWYPLHHVLVGRAGLDEDADLAGDDRLGRVLEPDAARLGPLQVLRLLLDRLRALGLEDDDERDEGVIRALGDALAAGPIAQVRGDGGGAAGLGHCRAGLFLGSG